MTSILEDILAGVKSHLADKLTTIAADEVVIGYPDDRVAGEEVREIDKVAIGVYGFSYDPGNRYSGRFHDVVKDTEAIDAWLADPETAPVPTAQLRRLPLPFGLYLQIDTYCPKQFEDLQLTTELSGLLASGMKVTTPDGREYWPSIEPGADMSELTEEGFHKVYRFSIPIWLDDPHEALEVALLVKSIFDINQTQLIVEANDVQD